MASDETWFLAEVTENDILLSETEENGIITRTYIAPLSQPLAVENPTALALPEKLPIPNLCPHCGNCISPCKAFNMHLRTCQQRRASVDRKNELPAKYEWRPVPRERMTLGNSNQNIKQCHKSFDGHFRCIFCSQEFKVHFADGQVRRRYACDECGQKARANEAERKKNPRPERKTIACDQCGKPFKLEGFLVRHKLVCPGLGGSRKREYKIPEGTNNKRRKQDVSNVKLEGTFYELVRVENGDHEYHEDPNQKIEDES